LWGSEAALDREKRASIEAVAEYLNNIMKESIRFRRDEEIDEEELIILA